MKIKYSMIIPVYNRPEEVQELLSTIEKQTYTNDFEVIIIEDGSCISSENIVISFQNSIPNLRYIYKQNSGPGDSRNYGMRIAQGDYFIILDSDCLLPEHYLESVDDYLQNHYVDCFGGRDASTDDFSDIQKAINYAMTSFFTTAGIRGNKNSITRFEPRSFNMGISKKAFEHTQGYGKIHPGEDPDLTIRLWKAGFETAFIEHAFVYHKRRISWRKYWKQISKFGQTRPILNHWHPNYAKFVHWLPLWFVIGLIISIIDLFSVNLGIYWIFISYFVLILYDSSKLNKSLRIGILSVWAVLIQFVSYGIGFARSVLKISFNKEKTPQELFPHLFFK